MLDELRGYIRYAVRVLWKSPGLTAVVILTLTLGIGANTAIFSVVNDLLLRPLSFPEPDRILRISAGTSYADLADLDERSKTVERMGGIRAQFFDLTQNPEPERIRGALVAGDFFALLGIPPAMGRAIEKNDDQPGGERVVVLSDRFWRSRLAMDPQVLGKTVSLSGVSYRVVGVLPAGFEVPALEAEVYAPLRVESPQEAAARGAHTLVALARMKPGVDVGEARAELGAIYSALEKEHPEENTGVNPAVLRWQDHLVRNYRSLLWMLLGAVGFVLLIAVANLSGLLAARAASRGHEIAVRRALGAGRRQIVSQLLVESLLLSLAGGAGALLIAPWISDLILALSPGDIIPIRPIRMDLNVLLFTGAIAVLTGILFGLFPALHATRPQFNEVLNESARGSEGRSILFMRNVMIVAELTLALVLLVGAGLLLRSFLLLLGVSPGFQTEKMLTMNITLPIERYGEIPRRTVFFQQVLDGIAALPGVESVSMNSELPFGTGEVFHNLAIEGRAVEPGSEPEVYSRSISTDYFETLNIPVLKGRAFTAADTAQAQPVAVVNESFARAMFPGEDPIGKRVNWARNDTPVWMTIVGVVSDIRAFSMDQSDQPALYAPFAQEQQFWKTWMNVVVRCSGDPSLLVGPIRKEVARADNTIPVADVQTMDRLIRGSFAERRFYMVLIAAFAGLALFLAGLGIYGVFAYSVNRRVRDLGIRMALGARKSDIVSLVIGQALRLTAAGLLAGGLCSLALSRLVKNLLYGIGPSDPATFAAVSILLGLVAIIACYVPARRAASVDPVVALRYE